MQALSVNELNKMQKKLIISVSLNIFFILTIIFLIYTNGGIENIKNKISLKKPEVEKTVKKEKPYWYYTNYEYWLEKKTLFEILPNDSNEIIFIGNSITDGCEWHELFSNKLIKNRGIGGDNTEGILARLSEITESNPSKIFINVGTNDIALKYPVDKICKLYSLILDEIHQNSPETKIFIQSVLPSYKNPSRNNDTIIALNSKLKTISNERNLSYIDLFSQFIDSNGQLDTLYSYDGVHLNGNGYLLWKKIIEKHLMD